MKIQFTKTYLDPTVPGRFFQPGWVAEFTDADAERAIAAGFAVPAPVDAFCRKYAAPELVSAECVTTAPTPEWTFTKTDKTIEIDELIAEKPQVVPKTGRFKL